MDHLIIFTRFLFYLLIAKLESLAPSLNFQTPCFFFFVFHAHAVDHPSLPPSSIIHQHFVRHGQTDRQTTQDPTDRHRIQSTANETKEERERRQRKRQNSTLKKFNLYLVGTSSIYSLADLPSCVRDAALIDRYIYIGLQPPTHVHEPNGTKGVRNSHATDEKSHTHR